MNLVQNSLQQYILNRSKWEKNVPKCIIINLNLNKDLATFFIQIKLYNDVKNNILFKFIHWKIKSKQIFVSYIQMFTLYIQM